MRLLIVSQYFWPETFRINDLARELIARGHEVTILTGLPNYPDGKIFSQYRKSPRDHTHFAGAPVIRVPVIPRGSNSLQLLMNYLSFVVSGCLFGRSKLRGRTFDAIFVFQTSPISAALPALWVGRKHRTPVLMWVLDLWPETLSAVGVVTSPRLLKLVGSLVRFIYRSCALILVQSRAFAGNVERYAGGRQKIRYFPGWAENVFEDTADAADAPEMLPYAESFKVLFAGNIGHAQDFPAIIAAADLLRDTPNLVWIVVGDGRAASDAKAEVVRRGLESKVIFLGRFQLDRMPSFFVAADALLVSLRDEPIWAMTIPGKVQSYLASGKPLLAMLNGEGARVIEDADAGLVGPAGNAQMLAENVSRLMAMAPEERVAMGTAGRRYCAREFDQKSLIDRLENWVADLQDGQDGLR